MPSSRLMRSPVSILQVSISGQALVFVTRCTKHSFLDRAGGFTYLAFFGAQVGGGQGSPTCGLG